MSNLGPLREKADRVPNQFLSFDRKTGPIKGLWHLTRMNPAMFQKLDCANDWNWPFSVENANPPNVHFHSFRVELLRKQMFNSRFVMSEEYQ